MPGLDPGISLRLTGLTQSYLIPGSSPGDDGLRGEGLLTKPPPPGFYVARAPSPRYIKRAVGTP